MPTPSTSHESLALPPADLLRDVQWLLDAGQRKSAAQGGDEAEPSGQSIEHEDDSLERLRSGQTVAISLRYLRAIVRDLTALAEERRQKAKLAAKWRAEADEFAAVDNYTPEGAMLASIKICTLRRAAAELLADKEGT